MLSIMGSRPPPSVHPSSNHALQRTGTGGQFSRAGFALRRRCLSLSLSPLGFSIVCMKATIVAFYASAVLFQRELNPHLLTEPMAAQIAFDYTNIKLKDQGFHSTKEGWRGEFRHGRWHMQYSPSMLGWNVLLSFKADGTDKKIEGFGFSNE